MGDIQILDKNTIDQIAAGEVVERPASVVKELAENSIDADATAITVEIRDGGASLIRITDNGGGIPADQVRLAFTRHATSKIRKLDDLVQISSLGFRGEALASIASVARVELITKTPESLTGTRYCIEGGEEKEIEEIGAPGGTTFLVRNLFYNTPARAKFLKSAGAEGNRIAAVVEELALSHPEISFKLLINGKNRLFTTGNGNLRDIVFQIYGRDMAKQLIPVEDESSHMKISGFLGNPEIARGNRNFENYYINGRFVKSSLIARAIEDGYHGFMMQHRYPFTLLYLEINPELVDVNVHPAKMEVRISEGEQISRQLTLAVQNALFTRERIPQISLDRQKNRPSFQGDNTLSGKETPPEPFERARRAAQNLLHPAKSNTWEKTADTASSASARLQHKITEQSRHKDAIQPQHQETSQQQRPVSTQQPQHQDFTQPDNSAAQNPHAFSAAPSSKADVLREEAAVYAGSPSGADKHPQTLQKNKTPQKPEQTELFPEKLLEKSARQLHRMIGQLFGTYWLIEFQDQLYIVDQHAAHEKVMYERLMKAHREKTIHSQMIAPAKVLSLTATEASLLEMHLDTFRALGFIIEPFGGTDYRITAVPSNLYGVSVEQLFTDILDSLGSLGNQPENLILEKLASMSCKAAVKGNHTMSVQEADALINELLELENPYNCPHGRPTIVSMSHYELDRKFKRIV
ncbi:MAG: DNA mismatch repair endonuclease MutL [Eubacterium sp.]|nr:DNA mismatch repair endonuclease MutL [Eubacterium sp.]